MNPVRSRTMRNPAAAVSKNLKTAAIYRRVAGYFPSGVALLSAGNSVMVVSSLQWLSFQPPLISIAIDNTSISGGAILGFRRFHVRLLRSGEEGSAREYRIPCGDGLVEIDCTVAAVHPAGDHQLVIAEVCDASTSDGFPVLYWRQGFHSFRPHYDFLESAEAFEEFVAAWERGTLAKSRWTHAAHVAICAWYTVREGGDLLEKMTRGIIRYNAAVGTLNTDTSGYHATLTRFWAQLVARLLAEFSDPWQAVRYATTVVGEERDLHCLYYSFDVVRSIEARRTWIAPDLVGPFEL